MKTIDERRRAVLRALSVLRDNRASRSRSIERPARSDDLYPARLARRLGLSLRRTRRSPRRRAKDADSLAHDRSRLLTELATGSPDSGTWADPFDFAATYRRLSRDERLAALCALASALDATTDRAIGAARAILAATTPQARAAAIASAHGALEPRWNQFLRRLLALDDGTTLLVDMRADLRELGRNVSALRLLETDLKALLTVWFHPRLLELRRITWDSPASLLEKLAQREAVHPVAGWEDLKNRLDRDRRVYALFHPLVPDEPLVFVEVALTSGLASEISTLLDPSEVVDDPETATSAIFYSISNTQPGLAGINIGAQLVKSVISALARELPRLRTFATLSPLPGFRPWAEHNAGYTPQAFATLANSALGDSSAARKAIVELCAIYLLQAKRPDGRALDPVANFHLSNGARMEQINWLADASPRCLKSSVGLMVTYVYRPNEIADNAARYEADGIVAAAGQWRRLASSPAEPVPAASKARSAR